MYLFHIAIVTENLRMMPTGQWKQC